MRLLLFSFAVCLMMVLTCSLGSAAVVTNTLDGGAGSLRQAIADAAPGETITFAPGLSGQTIRLISAQALLINKSMTIDGSALVSPLTISGDSNGDGLRNVGDTTVFDVYSPTPTSFVLRRIIIKHGYRGWYAGAINAGGVDITLDRVEMADCVNDVIHIYEGTLLMEDCVVRNNLGRGVFNDLSTAVCRRCAFIGNTSGLGGAGFFNYGGLTMENCTVVGNSTRDSNGGGVFSLIFPASLTHCTIVGNSAFGAGGGADLGTGGVIKNCIISGNSAAGGAQDFAGTPATGSGGNLIGGAPVLAPLGSYGGFTPTMPPLLNSPVIDAGVPTALVTDQRGLPRPVGAAADIGAAEQQASDASLFWPLDFDGDGMAYGIEFSQGSDPLLSDAHSVRRLGLSFQSGSGRPVLQFGYNPQAAHHSIWVLKRASSLNPAVFVEIYRFHGPSQAEILNGTTSTRYSDRFEIIDVSTASGPKFYRFEALTP